MDNSFYLMPVFEGTDPEGIIGPYLTYEAMRLEAVKLWKAIKHVDNYVIFWLTIDGEGSPKNGRFTNEELATATARWKPIKIVCGKCSTENVRQDAWAEWDVAAQKWVLGSTYDQGFCEECEDERTLMEVEIEPIRKECNESN